MITVEVDAAEVERRLRAGEITCPSCAGALTGWGCGGRRRRLRGMGEALIEAQPRRTRCSSCARTQVLLPVTGLLRRADGVEVVGAALEAKARGVGHRRIAAGLGRPPSTVRGAAVSDETDPAAAAEHRAAGQAIRQDSIQGPDGRYPTVARPGEPVAAEAGPGAASSSRCGPRAWVKRAMASSAYRTQSSQ
ncbi:hypothetical protein [Nonomuraea sp. NPDC049400]|uniref:hypothetical protein n=1 Tax=Nonomuraea sp. NPDC049400 TaxID=3364352 RepID=UPI0037B3FADA